MHNLSIIYNTPALILSYRLFVIECTQIIVRTIYCHSKE